MPVDINAVQQHLNKYGFLDTRIIANPSEEFIRKELEGLFNDPEVMNIKISSTIVDNRSQGTGDNGMAFLIL
jgi:hypothetical protein